MNVDNVKASLQRAKAGDVLKMVRKGLTGYVDARYEAKVERATPKRLYVDRTRYIERETGELKPRYLDYTTKVESVVGT
jgi:hypothetical protein